MDEAVKGAHLFPLILVLDLHTIFVISLLILSLPCELLDPTCPRKEYPSMFERQDQIPQLGMYNNRIRMFDSRWG